MRDGIQLSEAITGDGAAIFRHACWMDLEGIHLGLQAPIRVTIILSATT